MLDSTTKQNLSSIKKEVKKLKKEKAGQEKKDEMANILLQN